MSVLNGQIGTIAPTIDKETIARTMNDSEKP